MAKKPYPISSASPISKQEGLTVKDAWRDYAKGCAKPYVYTHFSTLYRKWLEDQAKGKADREGCASSSTLSDIEDYSADEDHLAEEYWRRKCHPRAAVHALSGYNCSLKVRNDELVSFDTGEERSFRKVTHGLQAIIFLGEGGFITIDAIKWCEAQGVAICVLDWHGELGFSHTTYSSHRCLDQAGAVCGGQGCDGESDPASEACFAEAYRKAILECLSIRAGRGEDRKGGGRGCEDRRPRSA